MKTSSVALLALVASVCIVNSVNAQTAPNPNDTNSFYPVISDADIKKLDALKHAYQHIIGEGEKVIKTEHGWTIEEEKVGVIRDSNGETYTIDPATEKVIANHTVANEHKRVARNFSEPVTTLVKNDKGEEVVKTVYKAVERFVDVWMYEIEVKRTIPSQTRVESVSQVLKGFYKTFEDITEQEYKEFSLIASTDGNKYWSDYIYWEVRDSDVRTALSKINEMFVAKLDNDYIQVLADEIENCAGENHYVERVFKTESQDRNTASGWTIYHQYFVATCSSKDERNQFFAWVGGKSGIYLPGQFGEDNAKKVSGLIKTWLKQHIVNLVNCKGNDTPKPSPHPDWTESSTSHEGTNHADAAKATGYTPEGSVTVTVTSTSTANGNSGSGSASMQGGGSSGPKKLSMGN